MLMRQLSRRFLAIRSNGGHFKKPLLTADEAIELVKPGSVILSGGFGLCGIPEKLIGALSKRPKLNELTVISNDCGTEDFGLGLLVNNGQVSKVVASYIGENEECVRRYLAGELELELIPQGTIAESLRSHSSGLPYFYTRSGTGTIYASGELITKYFCGDRKAEKYISVKPVEKINGRDYLKEKARSGDIAFVKAWKADGFGNLIFKETARNFNPTVAKAATITIAEVEELVPTGAIDPDQVHLPGIYVDKIVLGGSYEKRIMHKTASRIKGPDASWMKIKGEPLSEAISKREQIAKRAALEFREGFYVNLGIGIPEHSSNFIPKNMVVHINSENGVLGLGPFPRPEEVDPDLINAGKETVTVFSGASYFSSDESFAMIRGGHFDFSMMGAFEVSQFGDLANWIIPGKMVKGMGGAMDLANSGSKIIITMSHTNKDGRPKIIEDCNLPLTAKGCVDRIITECAVFDVDKKKGLKLIELANGESVESIKDKTGCNFAVSDNLISS